MLNIAGWWRRRADNRPQRAPTRIIVWSKPDCCLCERAHDVLDRVAKDYPLAIEENDITTDPVAFEQYRYSIPVVQVDGGPTFEGKVTEYWLRQALERNRAAAE